MTRVPILVSKSEKKDDYYDRESVCQKHLVDALSSNDKDAPDERKIRVLRKGISQGER
jgi:hypothetical protein